MTLNRCGTDNKYIYNLPFPERVQLCKILNRNDRWMELAGKWMHFQSCIIERLSRESNPADELLTLWGNHNHTISELFFLLLKMKDYQGMIVLRPFIDEELRSQIDNCVGNLQRLSHHQRADDDSKDLKIGTQNFNRSQPPPINVPKVANKFGGIKEGKLLNRSSQPTTIVEQSNSNNMLVPSVIPPPTALPALHPVAGTSKNINALKFPAADTALPAIAYEELARATNGWSKDIVIGRGGFGTVFRGRWKNTQVAIKRIEQHGSGTNESHKIQIEQSVRELKFLNSYRHDNILSLYAYSMDTDTPCLIYQFMPNGSLEDRLLLRQGTKPITWLQRHEIAKGTARGLQFLHTIGEKPLIHGDIKSANILLDKNLEPRIGDFGLAREGPEKDEMKVSRVHGTRPYLPDEFLHGKNLSIKIDTYSYGIVLFELATGLSAYDDRRPVHKFLKDFIDNSTELLIDKKAGTADMQVNENLIVLGKWCSNRLAKDRPEMVSVLQKLDQL